jgi:sulfite exporter TauE/SafE
MSLTLAASAALMGLAGSLHCAGMCSAACTAVAGRCTPQRPGQGTMAVLTGRLLAYAGAGALVATAAAGLRWLGEGVAWLRPIWSALQLALLVLGLWLLVRGRMPAAVQGWIESFGQPRTPAAVGDGAWQVMQIRRTLPGGLKAGLLGLLWPAIPCGLLHGALLVASMASGPLAGAGVMAAFALTSSVGLVAGPALWFRLRPLLQSRAVAADASATLDDGGALALRLAGAMLVASVGWTLGHGLLEPLQAWCA